MPPPPCNCVSKLFLIILKGMEEEQAQQLDSTAFASFEAVAEAAGCTSLGQYPRALLGGLVGMAPGSSVETVPHSVSAS